jgi:hypothetical protein
MFDTCRPMGRLFYLVGALVALMISTFPVVASPSHPSPSRQPGSSAYFVSPPPQGGPAMTTVSEVREHDFGWGQANDRNLLGRFNTQTFSLPRLARTQSYFLRLYDGSSPPRYSRHAEALHIDYPL